MNPFGEESLKAVVDAQVFGARSAWEKHEIAGQTRFIKAIAAQDGVMKARIANRFDALGFIPTFFHERGQEFVVLDAVKPSHYATVEEAFVAQILQKL